MNTTVLGRYRLLDRIGAGGMFDFDFGLARLVSADARYWPFVRRVGLHDGAAA